MQPDDHTIRRFRLDGTGVGRVLGQLESSILEAIWDLTTAAPTATIQQVCTRLGAAANYKTVQTVMNRLVDKGLLRRETQGRAHGYAARLTRAELAAQVTRNVLQSLLAEYGDLAIAQFVETVREAEPEQLAELQRLIAAPPQEEA